MKAEWKPWEIGRLTLDQLCCLMDPNPPGSSEVVTSSEDFEDVLTRRKEDEARWHSET